MFLKKINFIFFKKLNKFYTSSKPLKVKMVNNLLINDYENLKSIKKYLKFLFKNILHKQV